MAHKKAGSSSKNGRDSVGQRLGVKAGDGQLVHGRLDHRPPARPDVPVRPGTGLGHDYTVFATTAGHVRFEHATKSKKRIRVISADEVAAASIRAEAAEAASAAKRAGKAERAAGRTTATAPKRRTTKSTTESASAEA